MGTFWRLDAGKLVLRIWGQAEKQMGAKFLGKRAPILSMNTVELLSSYKALFHGFFV